ncbi:solute carrier family 35 member C2 [Bacillus rossius redtenbacheri]|uniref:solute carrier family 35 member C2 n=1 Tax=Bacillus rossius redtenbacheri TaxID=93214 RepID=UPI002FDD10AA
MSKLVLNGDPDARETGRAKPCSAPCVRFVLRSVALILLYFSLSVGLTFYQRLFLKDFHFPLSVVLVHLVLKLLLAWLYRVAWACYSGQSRVALSWDNFLARLGPAGVASGLDVAFSNWGLELNQISLYTMTKSTSVIFILGFSILFKLEKKSWSLVLIVLMIAAGLFLFTYKATQFDTVGFILVLMASLMSGVRWTLAQLVMQKSKLGLHNPLDMIFFVQPWMIVGVLPFAVAFEGRSVVDNLFLYRAESSSLAAHIVLTTVGGALLAFAMEVSEFLVVGQTSSLTLSIACVFKEAVTVVLAVEWTGDRLSPVNVLGLLVCLGGILVHARQKVVHAREAARPGAVMRGSGSELKAPLLSEEGGPPSEPSDADSDGDSSAVLLSVLQHWDNVR